jgi:rubrerythrin
MAQFDAIEEILTLAIEREVQAYQLYTDLARRTASPMLRKVFEDFAAEELDHKAQLELEIIKAGRVVRSEQKGVILDMDDYPNKDVFASDLDLKDVLSLAIEKEGRSVRFYVDLAAQAYDSQSREVLLLLAEQEAGHKARFQLEYERLSFGS